MSAARHAAPAIDRDYALGDNLTRSSGRVYLTGTQALVRLMLDQARLDRAAGRNTAGFVSGYRGSPLGAVDQQMWRAKAALDAHGVRFLPAINEDLAATACLGSQRIGADPKRRVDGVYALWYGKGPGVDRAGDALKHGNAYGTSPLGGVLVVAGDDHGCVSSSMPHQSDHAFMAWSMPVLHPASIADYLEFGLYGWALSRFSGAWVGFKAISEVVEGGASLALPALPRFHVPAFEAPPGGLHLRWPDYPSLDIEARIAAKLAAARAFAEDNAIDRLLSNPEAADLAILTTGKAHGDVMEALRVLGLDLDALTQLGVRLYKIGQSFPLAPRRLDHALRGVAHVLIVEEKGPIVENQVKDLLYNRAADARPSVSGKTDAMTGAPFLSALGELRPSRVAGPLAAWLARHRDLPQLAARLSLFAPSAPLKTAADSLRRTPYFCSGCPHNTSTRVPAGSRARAGIGCHFMAAWMERDTDGLIQMGGEGVDWIAQSLFSDEPHLFQNLGDGTYFHSGSMAIRQAIAAGANITYKILYNDAVAMTGGQPVDGVLTVPQIAAQVLDEGAREAVVVTDEPEKYAQASLPSGVSVQHRAMLDMVQRRLREIKGVTVLIYDQTCAAEKRRRRKKGDYPDPPRRVFINAEICEGCGDCGRASNCLSVIPVETELGRKRAIDQASCNKDYSCVEGFCPSFVSVIGGAVRKTGAATLDEAQLEAALGDLAEPAIADLAKPFNLLFAGVGGTGVVTVAALVAMAAHLEGKGASQLDFMGFAQKGGAVLSHVRLGATPALLHQVRIDVGAADVVMACDPLVAANSEALATIARGHSRVIVNDHELVTGDFTRNPDFSLNRPALIAKLAHAAGAGRLEAIDAVAAAQRLMGDGIGANVLLLGYAWQKGLIPVSRAALERAIELNGVAVRSNRRAFALGRLMAAGAPVVALEAGAKPAPRDLAGILAHRSGLLRAYQSPAYAARFERLVALVAKAEAALDGEDRLAKTVARNLYKLMAYKDEYEVARLYADGRFAKAVARVFEGDYRLRFHLAPPILGRKKPGSDLPAKSTFGPWMMLAFKALARFKWLRGTPLDPFGRTAERRMERALIAQYEADLAHVAAHLTAANKAAALALAAVPEEIRGFGHVKRASVDKAAARRAAWLAAFNDPQGNEVIAA
ncbi:MAG: indolepyruvate ferredoxin oxidoreductase family protein [Pseudomonadota bacterium]